MKLSLNASAAIAAFVFFDFALTQQLGHCTTEFGTKKTNPKTLKTRITKSTSTIPASTVTVVKTKTRYRAKTTSFSTITDPSSTSTVPTPYPFTPLISARNYTPPADPYDGDYYDSNAGQRRGVKATAAVRIPRSVAPSVASYPQYVLCTEDFTKQAHPATLRTTTTSTVYRKTVTATTTVAASTVLAACQSDNILNTFDNQPIGGRDADHILPICNPGGYDYYDDSPNPYACGSAYNCCVQAIWSGVYSGWTWSPYGGGTCSGLAGPPYGEGGWVFYGGGNSGNTYYGNGVGSGGQWDEDGSGL